MNCVGSALLVEIVVSEDNMEQMKKKESPIICHCQYNYTAVVSDLVN